MMVIILFVGLGLIALLAVFLKRRHARKVDKRRAAASGFPAAGGGSSPDIGHYCSSNDAGSEPLFNAGADRPLTLIANTP